MQLNINPTLKQGLGWLKLEDKKTNFILFGGGAGGGKAQPLSSLVLTPNGFKSMGSIKLNDKILTPNNTISNVIAIHPQGIKDIYELVFIDGSKIKVTDEHLFDCWIAKRKSRRRIRDTKDIIELFNKNKHILFPLSKPLDFGKDYNEISPYLIGVLLGDGGLTNSSLNITTADKSIIDKISKELIFNNFISKGKAKYRYNIKCGLHNEKGYCINLLKDKLKELDMLCKCESKRIPKVLMNSSLIMRLELIKGLMDTDGTIDKRGHCSFTSKSKGLCEDLQYLIRGIGGKATLTKTKSFCWYNSKKREGIYWELYINTNNNLDLFYLERKRARCKRYNGGFELGKRLIKINKLNPEQAQCITILDKQGLYISDDFTVTHNSWLGCEWLLKNCLAYPGTRWFISRTELKRLLSSTFITFVKVCNHHKISRDLWTYNGQYNYIQWFNGSRIDLLDLKKLPSDPLYQRLGSMEYTGGWIEEAGETDFGAFDVLKTRVGRWLNKEYNLIPKIFITCNPTQNWLYYDIYKPYKEKTLEPNYSFIQSLYGDNPYTIKEYGDMLSQIKDKTTLERLKFGLWEYTEDPARLFEYESIIDMFTNKVEESDKRYISCDVARFGDDKTVIMYWKGMKLKKVWTYPKTSTKEVRELLEAKSEKYKIQRSHIIVDEDGVGGGVVDEMKGIKGFVNNSSPMKERGKSEEVKKVTMNYRNLKSQCYFYLADMVNKGEISIYKEIPEIFKKELIEELEQIKRKDPDKDDKKISVLSKEEIKEKLGRSTDLADALMMRMWFKLKGSSGILIW